MFEAEGTAARGRLETHFRGVPYPGADLWIWPFNRLWAEPDGLSRMNGTSGSGTCSVE